MKVKLTEEDRINIKRLHSSCKERRHADKLKSILLLGDGYSCVEVGKILLLDDDTIRKYRNLYFNQGATSLLSDKNTGTKPLLTVKQIAELDAHISKNTYTDSKGINAWLKLNFGVNYSPSGINSLLGRLNFVYKKPVLTPCKADPEKQKTFIKEYKEIKESLEIDDQIYFMDGVHPQHNTIASYGWIKKGKTKFLKTNNGRKRTNINGALNLATKELFYVEDERINSQTMINLLNIILSGQKNGRIYIVLDNARYYHSKIVKEFLKEHPRIILKFLPPYSPNLNIIERLWKILKKKVVYNKFYLKFQDFRNAVINFLDTKIWANEQFEKILSDNFQIIVPTFSGSYL